MNEAEKLEETPLDRRVRETRAEVERLRLKRARLDEPIYVTSAFQLGSRDLEGERKTADIDLRNAQNVLGELLLHQVRQLDAGTALVSARNASDEDLREDARKREERREFWFRRFNLSLGLAHGAGLAAITSKMFDKDITAGAVAATWWSMASFAVGLSVAGTLPIALYFERPKVGWWMAIGSAFLFLWALAVALAGAAHKAQHVWPLW